MPTPLAPADRFYACSEVYVRPKIEMSTIIAQILGVALYVEEVSILISSSKVRESGKLFRGYELQYKSGLKLFFYVGLTVSRHDLVG